MRVSAIHYRTLSAALLIGCLITSGVHGEPKVTHFFPAGGQIGSETIVKVGGTLPNWPVKTWVDRHGLEISVVDLADAKSEHQLAVRASSDATPGVYWIRLIDSTGASAPKPFVVGVSSECQEVEPNNRQQQATRPTSRADRADQTIVFNGQLKRAGDVDVFAFDVHADQTLVADIDSHVQLGSDVDMVMQIVSPTGFVVAQNDDQHSLDPRIAFDVPFSGTWFVRVFGFPATPTSRIQFAGSDSYVYRLTVSTGPTVEFSMPMAAQTEGETRVRLFGWNLPPSLRSLTISPDPVGRFATLQPVDFGHSIRIPRVRHPVLAERNMDADEPFVDAPVTISGRIEEPGDVDGYQLELQPNESLIARLESRSLGYPLDCVLVLRDADGKQLSRVDDTSGSRDAILEYTSEQGGRHLLEVQDLHGRGGHNLVYLLTIQPLTPDFVLTLDEHQVLFDDERRAEISVTISRLGGYSQPIEISAEGLPVGVQAVPIWSRPDSDSAKSVKLTLNADSSAEAAGVAIRVGGTAAAKKNFATIPQQPNQVPIDQLWLTIPPAGTGEPTD